MKQIKELFEKMDKEYVLECIYLAIRERKNQRGGQKLDKCNI
jgi:hypothetical protein